MIERCHFYSIEARSILNHYNSQNYHAQTNNTRMRDSKLNQINIFFTYRSPAQLTSGCDYCHEPSVSDNLLHSLLHSLLPHAVSTLAMPGSLSSHSVQTSLSVSMWKMLNRWGAWATSSSGVKPALRWRGLVLLPLSSGSPELSDGGGGGGQAVTSMPMLTLSQLLVSKPAADDTASQVSGRAGPVWPVRDIRAGPGPVSSLSRRRPQAQMATSATTPRAMRRRVTDVLIMANDNLLINTAMRGLRSNPKLSFIPRQQSDKAIAKQNKKPRRERKGEMVLEIIFIYCLLNINCSPRRMYCDGLVFIT